VKFLCRDLIFYNTIFAGKKKIENGDRKRKKVLYEKIEEREIKIK
jgi:hypothetical protein